jgi:hypothetical protein
MKHYAIYAAGANVPMLKYILGVCRQFADALLGGGGVSCRPQ